MGYLTNIPQIRAFYSGNHARIETCLAMSKMVGFYGIPHIREHQDAKWRTWLTKAGNARKEGSLGAGELLNIAQLKRIGKEGILRLSEVNGVFKWLSTHSECDIRPLYSRDPDMNQDSYVANPKYCLVFLAFPTLGRLRCQAINSALKRKYYLGVKLLGAKRI